MAINRKTKARGPYTTRGSECNVTRLTPQTPFLQQLPRSKVGKNRRPLSLVNLQYHTKNSAIPHLRTPLRPLPVAFLTKHLVSFRAEIAVFTVVLLAKHYYYFRAKIDFFTIAFHAKHLVNIRPTIDFFTVTFVFKTLSSFSCRN